MSGPSLKRAAWAFGCAKKGSAEEAKLLAVLLAHEDLGRQPPCLLGTDRCVLPLGHVGAHLPPLEIVP